MTESTTEPTTEPRVEVADLAKLMSDIRIGMLTTRGEDGRLVSRPMAQQEVEFDGDLWFFAERDSRKVAQLTADPHVALTLTSSTTWISVDGTATIVRDVAKARELWNAGVEAWLPQGPEDPSVVLIHVTAETAEYWDTPGGRIAAVLSFAKATLTGDRYEGGDHGTVRMRTQLTGKNPVDRVRGHDRG
jgi:general stress protein 26